MRRPDSLTIAFCSIVFLLPCYAVEDDLYRDNVIVVLDCSGSMGEAMRKTGTIKMEAAKSALKEVIRQVPPTTHVGILTFSAQNLSDDWIYPLGAIEQARLAQAIDRPQPGGGTPLGAYIKAGADRLLEQRQEQYGYGSYRLLVVTDGQAGDQDLVDAFAPEIVSRGIALDVIGVDMAQEHTLARVAQSYRSADDPESLRTAIEEVFAEVSQKEDSDADEEAFDLLRPIPLEMATAMLDSLTRSGNDPIGSHPQDSASRPDQSPQTPGQTAPGGPPAASGEEEDPWGIGKLILVVLVLIGMKSIFSSKKKKRRR